MKMHYFSLTAILASMGAQAVNLDTTAREYKVLLETSKFTYETERATVDMFTQILANTISQAIMREVTGVAVLDKERMVTYWDVPHSCTLREINYSFRERWNIYDNSDKDVTLKYRDSDRFISGYEDLSTNQTDFKTKVEEDILINNNFELLAKHSHSTKINRYNQNINKVEDIYDHFPGFEEAYGTIDPELPLVAVGKVNFYERRYEGQRIDLGQFDADIVLSLWYTSPTPQLTDSPVVAEVSFDYADPAGEYTQKVVQRAANSIVAIAKMSDWINLNAQTKTDYAYSYDPSFCVSTITSF